MKLSAVILARALAFVETFDLSPRGQVFYPNLVAEIVKKYQFQKFPQELKDFDEQKGVEFLEGRSGKTVIHKLVIYANGILVDTRENTSVSESVIHKALLWAKEAFGLNYSAGMIKRVGYVSNLTFYSEIDFDSINPALNKLSKKVSDALSDIHKEEIRYQTTSLLLQHDPMKRKNSLANFSISPRIETPFSEHKYFSEAPLPTELHIQFLEELEADLKRS